MLKRIFDVVVSSFLLMAGAPLFAVIAAGIFLSSPGPVLFRQERAGKEGRTFTLYKFRTMHPGPEEASETFLGDPRVFPLGRLLREYHFDELPQLWNILNGDMSLVGPRPGLPSQVERYSERERGRLRVRPGLTGLAQVSGNNELEWNDRIEVDLQYADNASLWLDLQILYRTVGTVLRKQGVYGPDGWVRDKR